MSLDRRTLLRTSAAGAAVGPFAGLVTMPADAGRPPRQQELVPVRDLRDGTVRLHLPRGFEYRSFHDTEGPVVLTDGTALPGRHDGMGAFKGPRGTTLLVRNHEVNNPQPAFGPGTPYDEMAGGGTTTVQVDRRGGVLGSFTSLNGTMMNCSGGQMPWGSWITCEETINGPDVEADFTGTSNVPLKQRHGYVFEVPVSHQPAGASRTASRSARPGASPTRRSPSTPARATSTSPRTTSASPRASTATARPRTPWRSASCATAAGCRC